MTLALALAALLAGAEPTPPVDTPIPSTSTSTPTATADLADSRARFEAARAALVADDLATAQRGFEEVAADPASPPALAEAARVLAETCRVLAQRGLVPRAPAAATAGPPRLDRSGRGQLAWFSTVYGIFVADGLAGVAGVADGKAYLALTIAGGATGLALSLGTTKAAPMSRGRAAAIEAATLWTSVNAATISAIADADGNTALGATIGAGLAGLAATAAATRTHAPSEGDVSLVSSGGFWGFSAAALSLTFLDDFSGKTAGWILLGGTDLGLLAGYGLARAHDLSRSRVLVIDAAGLLGALVGVAVPAFADARDARAYGGATLAGIAGGLALGTYLTRDWDRDDGAPRLSLAAPFATRLADGTVLAGLAGRF